MRPAHRVGVQVTDLGSRLEKRQGDLRAYESARAAPADARFCCESAQPLAGRHTHHAAAPAKPIDMRSAAAIGLRPRHCGTAALRGGGPSPLRPALRPAALLRPQRRHRPRLAESSTRAAAATPGAPGGGGNANGGSPGGSAAGSRRPTGDRSPANREPSERVLGLWRSCNAVCFDVDCEPLPVLLLEFFAG